MHKSALKWEMWGILFTVMVGAALHFVFAWAGKWPPVGIIAPVNESVWEHLKLAFWPSLVWAAIEYPRLKSQTKSFWTAKAAGIWLMPVIIILVFYAYTAFTHHPVLAVDISTFALAVTAGQMLSYALMKTNLRGRMLNAVAVSLILLLGMAYTVFTYLPPHLGVFRDESGQYGIIK